MNFRAAFRYLGRLILVLAIAELAPLACALAYGEGRAAVAFLIAALVTALVGGVLTFLSSPDGEIYRREGILIVAGSWVPASLFGALPDLVAATRQTLTETLRADARLLHPDIPGPAGKADSESDRRWTSGGQVLAEVMVPPNSPLVGRTLARIGFRSRYHCIVLGIERRSRMLRPQVGRAACRVRG